MKQFITKSLIHFVMVVLILIGYTWIYDALVPRRLGPNTKNQITQSFTRAKEHAYPVVILGNSRIYRGINPELFSVKAFNFAHDDDSYNQMYHKLKWLNSDSLKVVVLGVDYFTFSYLSNKRNYAYGPLFGDEYLDDYYNGPARSVAFYKDAIHQRMINYAGFDRTKFLIRSLVMGVNKARPRLKNNGQYIYPGVAKASDRIERDTTMLSIQKDYFERIVLYCQERDVRLVFVMPPTRPEERLNYTPESVESFEKYLSQFKNTSYLNFSEAKDYEMKDFSDITHLNEAAADRFSKSLNDSIMVIAGDHLLKK
jgi:hypothetical protein